MTSINLTTNGIHFLLNITLSYYFTHYETPTTPCTIKYRQHHSPYFIRQANIIKIYKLLQYSPSKTWLGRFKPFKLINSRASLQLIQQHIFSMFLCILFFSPTFMIRESYVLKRILFLQQQPSS
jgi:hypothetical protein